MDSFPRSITCCVRETNVSSLQARPVRAVGMTRAHLATAYSSIYPCLRFLLPHSAPANRHRRRCRPLLLSDRPLAFSSRRFWDGRKAEEAAQRRPPASPPAGRSREAAAPTSTVSRPLQLTESLRLLGAVLSLLRLTLSLLGRRPLGRGKGDSDPSATLFRRLCSLLDFLEDVREMRIGFLDSGGMGGTGGRGAGVGVAAAGGGGGLFGRSFQARCGCTRNQPLFFALLGRCLS